MPHDHEYAVMGGIERVKIGRYLSIVSGAISAGLVFALLAAVDLAKTFGLNVNVPPAVLSLFGAGMVFGVLYWILNRHAWKWPVIVRLLRVPNLAGIWDCQGESLRPDGAVAYRWNGEVTIVQNWDKLRIRLKTVQSASNSIAAALANDSVDGFMLLYQYRNDPRMDEPALASHIGCAVVTIANDLTSATAEYLNGGGRMTFGKMTWAKRK
ncbi:Cap15 family cyclic dinucleotide receptor domain-containing protein [Burkholderia multivorans]|uniref:Cap15 family cyclic dinucleotide receptor domain-containing protein n=1 Tax=Burkholderia multivorans TaxID=87883 RepID=UPI001906D9DA|nr:hypothetical protein [Burkholderia multivorans]MBJ9625746.1 hypothetical protein [Burkholderia multivorans]